MPARLARRLTPCIFKVRGTHPSMNCRQQFRRWFAVISLLWSAEVIAAANSCLPGWSGQPLVPMPTAGLPGWTVEHDLGSIGTLVLATNVSDPILQLNWNISTGDW